MSFKDWQRITIDGSLYRWKVQDQQTEKGADTFRRVIMIRAADHPPSKYSYISDEIGYFGLVSNVHSLLVTPKLVAACIRYALQQGWKPEENKDMSVDLTSELLAQLVD